MMVVLACLLLLAAALGAPLFAVIAGVAMLGFQSVDTPLAVMGIELYRIVDTPILLALPLFTFAGYLLGESKTSVRLVRLTQSLIGWMPGGAGHCRIPDLRLFHSVYGSQWRHHRCTGGVALSGTQASRVSGALFAGTSHNFRLTWIVASAFLASDPLRGHCATTARRKWHYHPGCFQGWFAAGAGDGSFSQSVWLAGNPKASGSCYGI